MFDTSHPNLFRVTYLDSTRRSFPAPARQGPIPWFLPPVLVPWNAVQKTVGHMMAPQGLYPERYRVDSFPSGPQFAAILSAAKRERRRRHPK
jgi:hypothetical protein